MPVEIVSLYLIREGARDDKLWVTGSSHQGFDVFYSPGEYRGSANRFRFNTVGDARCYFNNLFQSLITDVDPWEKIQVTTATTPSVLVPIVDLHDENIRDVLVDQIEFSLEANVTRDTA